ncbi:uncharacterized protein LOC143876406 [Tasmannia lanceolata]|uniref:uncharacterized protein LOC143876406 n=1 Tax=Tasmannia lanceolata TaxID=3420 RepID=UPI004063F1A5
MEQISSIDMSSMGFNSDWNFAFVASKGASGGILVAWDTVLWASSDVWRGVFSLSVAFCKCNDQSEWLFTGVYGPLSASDKCSFWEELNQRRGLCSAPWCIGGDFNEVLDSRDRIGGQRITVGMRNFADFIANNELVDLPLGGASFTWARGTNRSRLDRFLLSGDWLTGISEVYQQALPHSVSDHCPLLLSPKMESWGAPPFRFELAWLENPLLEAQLVRWWADCAFSGPSDVVIGKKLRFIKGKLKAWAKEQKEIALGRKRVLEDRLLEIHSLADRGSATAEDFEQQGRLIQEHKELLRLEEISWRQKSRVKWLMEGDKNTAFFHAIASARRRRNRIESLEVEGAVVSDRERIIAETIAFYRSLYSDDGLVRPIPQDICFSNLSLEASAGLEIPFSEEEIRIALFSLAQDKAPGPDGFCLAFFQTCWDTVKSDLIRFFLEFFEGAILDKGTGATFLVLIPKIDGASKVSDFRPISLVGSLYKVLAKVLADRIKVVLPSIISVNQSAFLGKRQILDCSLTANEAIDYYRRSGEGGILCKLDMEKAYDRVDWAALDYLMGRMGFGERWRGWIRNCLSSAWFSVLLNGSAKGFFKSSRGLRQGDPLSPFLFLIVAESLCSILKKGSDMGLYRGFLIGTSKVEVSLLQFADDTLLFCSPVLSQLLNLKAMLRCYEMVSGQRSNFGKSRLYAINVSESEASSFAGIMGCGLDVFPATYLASVAKRIEQIQRRFLWGGSRTSKGVSLLKWSLVCSPIKNGGLGIRRVQLFNQALMGKWLWRYGEEHSSLWVRVIDSKYGSSLGNWDSVDTFKIKGITVWRDILRLKSFFAPGVRFRVYRGDRIRFWQDPWCSSHSLQVLFPDLYIVSSQKEAWVSECFERVQGQVEWIPKFRRAFFVRELSDYSALISLLGSCFIKSSGLDRRIWIWNPSGIFSVKSFYLHLIPTLVEHASSAVWRLACPPRVAFFGWSVSWGRIQTIDFLRKRGMWLVDHCPLCLSAGESIDHLFIHCQVASYIWGHLFSRFGVSWVASNSMAEFIRSWDWAPWKRKGRILWKMCLLASWWFLWKERNARVFEGKVRSPYWIYIQVVAAVISWARSLPLFRFVSAYALWEGWSTICMESVNKVKSRPSWSPPPPGSLKLNFDGSSIGNPGAAGVGGLCRNHKGEVIWAYSGPLGYADSSEAEVRAIHSGILSMPRLECDSLIVEGDSVNVISWLSGDASPPWRFVHFFEEIEDRGKGYSMVFQHVRRSANVAADSLAKSGVSRAELECFDYLPP